MSSGHFVIVLPFLRIQTVHTVAGVEFLTLRDGDGNVPAALETSVAPLADVPVRACRSAWDPIQQLRCCKHSRERMGFVEGRLSRGYVGGIFAVPRLLGVQRLLPSV